MTTQLSSFILVNTTYEWRLVGGKHDYEGTLQVRVDNRSWAAFEGLSWGDKRSNVACRMFGFSMAFSPFAVTLEPETEPYSFYYDYFGCIGTKNSLLDCTTTLTTFTFKSEYNSSMYKAGGITRLFLRCLPGKCCTKGSIFFAYNKQVFYFTFAVSEIVSPDNITILAQG